MAACLLKFSSMKGTIRSIRTKEEAAATLTLIRRNLLPQDYIINAKNEDFLLLYDSGPNDDRVLIYSTRRNISLLDQSTHSCADETFKTASYLFVNCLRHLG